MTNRILYLIRNGEYPKDEEEADQEYGLPLTDTGRVQARLTAGALRGFPIRAIYHSPYQQVKETAEIIAGAFPDIVIEETALLRQYDRLQLEGDTLHPDIIRHLFASQRKQIETAFETFFSPVEETHHEILVCHANLIRDLICRAINVSPEAWAHMLIHHCGISTVAIKPDQDAELLDYNNIHHIPESYRTGV